MNLSSDYIEKLEAENRELQKELTAIANLKSKVTHFILVNEAAPYTKDADYFIEQGGLKDEWGTNWEPIHAKDLNEARQIGIVIRRLRFPNCHKTMGEK